MEADITPEVATEEEVACGFSQVQVDLVVVSEAEAAVVVDLVASVVEASVVVEQVGDGKST